LSSPQSLDFLRIFIGYWNLMFSTSFWYLMWSHVKERWAFSLGTEVREECGCLGWDTQKARGVYKYILVCISKWHGCGRAENFTSKNGFLHKKTRRYLGGTVKDYLWDQHERWSLRQFHLLCYWSEEHHFLLSIFAEKIFLKHTPVRFLVVVDRFDLVYIYKILPSHLLPRLLQVFFLS
jgi:hypothetical protein